MNPNPPNPESETPETDAFKQDEVRQAWEWCDFARSLELQRNQYRECMDKLADRLNRWHGNLCSDKNCQDKQALSLYTTLTKPKG